jgi:acetyl-CoA acetyltransferase
MSLRGRTAIAGLGITKQGKVYDHNHIGFAIEAVKRALDDAGLTRGDLDGLLVNPGLSWREPHMASFQLQQMLGLRDLRLSSSLSAGGAGAGSMVQYAAHAVASGLCHTVACVFSDTPLEPPRADTEARSSGTGDGGAAAAYAFARGLDAAYGLFGITALYAMVARRHMHLYGTSHDHLGAIAVAERAWANRNPAAQFYDTPMTLADYHRSRWVAEPFHLFDCCLVSNGGVAVIVTSSERAGDLARPPVYLLGMGQGHPGGDPLETLTSGAALARETAFAMAGITISDIDIVELYDCYTFTVLVSLEDYGFCPKGEGGPFVADGRIGPGGALPVNTGGGQLSAFYMWGMTPISEAVIQLRGDGGARQVANANLALASGNGGILSTHTALLLSNRV